MLKSKIMARIIAFGVLILLILTCGCLAGCEDNTSDGEYQFPDPYDMPRKLRRAAEEAYAEYREVEEFGEWDTPGDGILGTCFYGNYNGAVVIKSVGNLGHLPFCLGGYVFESGEAMILKVYYEGKIMDIADAYAGGIISSDDITKIAEIHTNHVWADMPQCIGISFAYPCNDCQSGNCQECEYICKCHAETTPPAETTPTETTPLADTTPAETTPAITTPTETTPAETTTLPPEETISSREVIEKNPPTAGLSSADQVQRLGIRMGDAIVEGYEYVIDPWRCDFFDEQTNVATYVLPQMSISTPNYARLAANGELPIVKYSDDIEIINNLDYVYSCEEVSEISFVPLFENAANGSVRTPTVPGLYYTEVLSTLWLPFYQDDNGNKAPSGMPKPQVGELYPCCCCYGFIVYVE